MNRTLGFFLGSAAVFAMLVYILGQPVPLAPPPEREPAPAALAIPPVDDPEQPGVAQSSPAPVARPAAAAAEPVPAAPATDEVALVEQWLEQLPAGAEQYGPPAPADHATPAPAAEPAGIAADPELEWFPVWDPFHSELSANAFARRLEQVTGLDYRVIRTDRAQYRVVVGYASEEQRIANLAAIEEATGLTITGGSR